MPRGRTLIRLRSHQEQKRRRLLMLGIPLLAIGSGLIWYISSQHAPQLESTADPVAVLTTPASMPSPAERLDSPPPVPQEEPNAVVANSTTNAAPIALNTPAPNTTMPAPTVASSSNDVPAPATANTSISEPLTSLTQTETTEPTPAPVEALPGSTLAQNPVNAVPTPNTPTNTSNPTTTATTTTTTGTTESTGAASPETTPPIEVSLVNEPIANPAVSPQSAPAVVINANTRSDNSNSKVSSTTLLALSGGIPLSTPRTLATPSTATPSGLNTTTRQAGNPPANPTNDPSTPPQGSGWIYAGQFSNGTWIQRGLVIGDQLPLQGQRYRLATGAKLRDAPPGRRAGSNNLGETIGFVNSGQSIQVVQIKNSGNSGHIWLQVVR